ncbi:L-aminoadipate-semialdehyde dehydrogenase-phosphopantetheinyl transferase-like [Carassius gibelio]|uniref:L-aminoadipate-semialdehyde dehydrogenase-phosphopantetheinyl transferase-like n=1 Tax=Carassius gibelio TaxID=101364 RepID=UPI0022786865|nr:L-aminoadipate-semialdehyde dehydrogenase-phosphopantetheinyl transferase-like [Carassius gibelio]
MDGVHIVYCISHLLIRKLLCEKIGLAWDRFRLERTARGKQFLPQTSFTPSFTHWNFSVSHQGDYTVLAGEPGHKVGVDVMKTSRPSLSVQEFLRIMNPQFTDLDWMNIRKPGSDLDQLDMFYRHWLLKESFIKAIGKGLGFDLQRVEFHISSNQMREGQVHQQTLMYLDGEEEDWTCEESLLDKDHHVAVTLGKQDISTSEVTPPLSFTLLSFSDLRSKATPLLEEDPAYWERFQSKKEAPLRRSEQQ